MGLFGKKKKDEEVKKDAAVANEEGNKDKKDPESLLPPGFRSQLDD